MPEHARPATTFGFPGLTFGYPGWLTISHKCMPGFESGDEPLGILTFDFHADPAANPDGLSAEFTIDGDTGQITISIVGDNSVHDVLGGKVADLRAQLRAAVTR